MTLRLFGIPALVLALVAGLMSMAAIVGGGAGTTPQNCNPGQPGPWTGEARIPMTSSYRIGSGFGPRFHPILHIWRNHNGIDLTHQAGAGPIVAMAAGTVTRAGNNGDAGNNVVLNHGGGLESVYLHLASVSVQVGQQVTAGQTLGIEGSTGLSTARHLHWGVRQNGAYIDPVTWAASKGIPVDGTVPTSPASTLSAGGPAATAGAASQSIAGWNPAQVALAAVIVQQAQTRGLDAWTATTGVMTAMGESSLTNPDHGDAARTDTIGLFQIGPEHGTLSQRMDPAWSANNFFDRLVAVPGYRGLEPTIAAHKAQRNRDPWHYQPYWTGAVEVVAHITNNPGLWNDLGNNGIGCAPRGGVPPLPTDCPPSGLASEANLQPTALNYLRCGVVTFPQVKTWGGYRPNAIDKQGHPAGLAIDVMIPDYRSAGGIALGDQVADWTIANRDRLAVKYLIWRQRQWTPSRGWVDMADRGGDTANHFDHVHVTLNSSPTTN